ncbi:hypothetical protein [Nocardioides sp. B-3]|uniref:hypothetical protein n=1 Tax=Nocardioides sp. B-3 TaxID=2895565 RepID=UPI002152942E|nr:hypothetical protein [Nocardioides sp. B-3]UUZ61946.1 hypothetical protein LP418_11105 [Nocardioides sp. B-3]
MVFVLDGVLIGAGDGRYLAWAGLGVLALYAPAALPGRAAPAASSPSGSRWSSCSWARASSC